MFFIGYERMLQRDVFWLLLVLFELKWSARPRVRAVWRVNFLLGSVR